MFESFDIDRNGKIDADELGRALAHYEYVAPLNLLPIRLLMLSNSLHVGPRVLDLLIKKYGEFFLPRLWCQV